MTEYVSYLRSAAFRARDVIGADDREAGTEGHSSRHRRRFGPYWSLTTEPAARHVAPAFVIVVAIAVYLNSIGNGFALDDLAIIQYNSRVHNLSAWRDIWFEPYWPYYGEEIGLYRPLIVFLYALQWTISGGVAWVFHAGNVLLHALATLLVFLLLDRLTSRVPAVVGALVFAVHPVHTEAVANVVGQAELVSATALFSACLVHITRPAGAAVSWPRRFALMALFAIALGTKESTVVLPGLLVVLDLAQRRIGRDVAGYSAAMLMPLFLLAATLALYLIVRFDVMGGALIGLNSTALPSLQNEHRLLNALRAFPEFLRLLVFPVDLVIDYGPAVLLPVDSLSGMTLIGGILLVGLLGLALATPWRPAAGAPAAWLLISLLIVSNLLFPSGPNVAERTLYTPSFALSLGLSFTWLNAGPLVSQSMRRVVPLLAAVAILLLAARSWQRNLDWASPVAVAAALARDHPESYRVHWLAGRLAAERGQFYEAEQRIRVAYYIEPRNPQLAEDYGTLLMRRGRVAEAIPPLERSYVMRPFTPGAVTWLAHAYVRARRWNDALALIAPAEALGASRVLSMPWRAHIYHGLGQYDKAVAAWRVALAHSSTDPWIVASFLARSLAVGGYHADAVVVLDRARQLASDATARHTLDLVRTAIQKGCYETMPLSQERASAAGPGFPACDPLGDYYSFEPRPAATGGTRP